MKAAAARRVAEAKALAEVGRLIPDAAALTDPLGTLAQLAGEADAFRQVLARRVNVLATATTGADADSREALRTEVALYERAIDRTARFCEGLIKSNWIERHAALEDRDLRRMVDDFRAALQLVPDEAVRDAVSRDFIARLRRHQDIDRAEPSAASVALERVNS